MDRNRQKQKRTEANNSGQKREGEGLTKTSFYPNFVDKGGGGGWGWGGERRGGGGGGEVMTYNKNIVQRMGRTAGYTQLNRKMVPKIGIMRPLLSQ